MDVKWRIKFQQNACNCRWSTARSYNSLHVVVLTRGCCSVLSPTYFLMSWNVIDTAVGKKGLFMCRIGSLFLLQRLKGSMSGDACDFNNVETRAVTKFFPLQGKAPKEIHAILIEILGEHAPLYATVKNWVAQFKGGDFSTCDAPRPGRPKTVTIP